MNVYAYRYLIPHVYAASLVLLVLTLLFGLEINGAKRWLNLGLMNFQPSEFAKPAIVLAVTYVLYKVVPGLTIKTIALSALLAALPIGLIFVQPDYGTGLLMIIAFLMMLFLCGLSWYYVATMVLSLPLVLWAMWSYVLLPYHKVRIMTFISSDYGESAGTNWNSTQSKVAVGSGGLFGKGWTEGTQTKLNFVPEQSTDFIFSALSEENGFFGAMFVLLLYTTLIYRAIGIVRQATSTFHFVLGSGMLLLFAYSVFINVAMVVGLLPIIGLPLPLMSYGGTSTIVSFLMLGVIVSIAKHRRVSYG